MLSVRAVVASSCALVVTALLAPESARAATILYRTDTQLIALSERVVHARVVAQRTTRPPESDAIYTITTLAVIEDFTGRDGAVIEVWELGGTFGNEVMYVGGAVEYAIGSDVVVCLERGPRGLRSTAMGLSKFDVVTSGTRRGALVRNMGDTRVAGARSGARLADRTLDSFRALVAQVTGRPSRRFAASTAAAPIQQAFTTFANLRWVEADSGTPVVWYRNSSAPPPTGADDTADIAVALSAWTDPPGGSLELWYGGVTSIPQDGSDGRGSAKGPWTGISSEGTGLITYEDPGNEIGSNTLAIAGGFGAFNGSGGTFNTTTWNRFLRAWVIFRKASELPLEFRQTLNFRRVLLHEIGHGIGLGHTQEDGSIEQPPRNIMLATCCYPDTPVPPGLGPDDLDGLLFIYPSAACTFSLGEPAAALPSGGGTGRVQVSAQAGCAWSASSGAAYVTITGGASGNGSGTVTFSVEPNTGVSERVGPLIVAGQIVRVVQAGTGPVMSVDRTVVRFAAAVGGGGFAAQTAPQQVRLSQAGAGVVSWSVATDQSWLVVTPAWGDGPAVFTLSVEPTGAPPPPGSADGVITFSFDGAGRSADPIRVALRTVHLGLTSPPVGSFDTPADQAAGLTGSLPVTGWALDDLEVARVRILRDPVEGEGAAPVFIGYATFVEGARPDVAAVFPDVPLNTRAGWGYLLLTNFLPDRGNGTFRLMAVADDVEGGSTLLGTETITLDNASAVRPFGTIDTPGPGATVSGTIHNFGWVLAPGMRRADPPGGGTVRVLIDGAVVGAPSQWTSRSDLSALFPAAQYPGVDFALGVFTFDSSAYANGVHTIAWVVTDNEGNTEGVGSRYFTVSNGMNGTATAAGSGFSRAEVSAGAMPRAVRDGAPLLGRRGHDEPLRPLVDRVMHGEELDRFEVHVGARGSGHMRHGEELGPLPTGSRLDPDTGVFTWQPGVGFAGAYDFVFTVEGVRHELRIVLHPKGEPS